MVSNGEEKNETPKPDVTEPSPNAQQTWDQLCCKKAKGKKFSGLLEQSLAKEPWTLPLPRSEGQHPFKGSVKCCLQPICSGDELNTCWGMLNSPNTDTNHAPLTDL